MITGVFLLQFVFFCYTATHRCLTHHSKKLIDFHFFMCSCSFLQSDRFSTQNPKTIQSTCSATTMAIRLALLQWIQQEKDELWTLNKTSYFPKLLSLFRQSFLGLYQREISSQLRSSLAFLVKTHLIQKTQKLADRSGEQYLADETNLLTCSSPVEIIFELQTPPKTEQVLPLRAPLTEDWLPGAADLRSCEKDQSVGEDLAEWNHARWNQMTRVLANGDWLVPWTRSFIVSASCSSC